MNNLVVKYFKRNPEAKVCHLVLQEVWGDGQRDEAGAYAKSKNGVVTTITRDEYDQWAAEQKTADEGTE